jgi:RNA polymerase sigma factor (sigma-70 family)
MRTSPRSTPDALNREVFELTQQHLSNREAGLRSTAEQEAAWHQFYAGCAPKIRRFAFACRIFEEEIDDCVQEVWRELLVRLPTFRLDETRGQFDTWLYSIVRSKTVNLQRSHKHQPTVIETDYFRRLADDRTGLPSREETHELLTLALHHLRQRLSECNYRILWLRLVEQRSVDEVAEELKLSHEQVWNRYSRGRQQLKEITESLIDGKRLLHQAEELSPPKRQQFQDNLRGRPGKSVSRSKGKSDPLGQGGSSVDLVFKRLEVGRRSLNPEWKVEWNTDHTPTPILYIRKLSMVAYAEMCGPEEAMNDHWAQIANAAVAAGVAAGIATIVATPTAAVEVFRAEFENRLCEKTGREVADQIHVGLSALQEPNGPWCVCKEGS